MDPHRCPRLRLARSSLHRAALLASLGWEGHAICPRLFPRFRGFPSPSRLCCLPMLSHLVTRHRSHRHLFHTLPALDPSILLLPVGGSLPCYFSPVRHLRLIPCRVTGAADHSDCLPKIILQAHPIKQDDQGVKFTLDTAGVQQGNHTIFRIEEGSLMPTLLFTLAPLLCDIYHHHHPVYHHRIHHHIKYGGGERIYLCHSTHSLKRRPIVSARPCYHHQPPPIRMEEPPGLGAHAVPFQYIQATGPVQLSIRLVQVQEDQV